MNEEIYEKQQDTIRALIGEIQLAISPTILLSTPFRRITFVRQDLMNAIDHEDTGITLESDCFNEMDFINADGKKVILKFISSLDPEQRVGYTNAAIYEY